MKVKRVSALFLSILCSLGAGCTGPGSDEPVDSLTNCDNPKFNEYEDLLILAPHPDDEVLGFAGLADMFLQQGKKVRTVVVTDGDGYCDACTLWNTGSIAGATCDAQTLSNLKTPERDSFAEYRRQESINAAKILGHPVPGFLAYPDTGIAAAWANHQSGGYEKPLHRSDFSMCSDCDSCGLGYGGGPATKLNSASLYRDLSGLLEEARPRTLIATTHPLDSHGDHSALGHFVREIAEERSYERTIAYSVIHAHTSRDAAFPDCWYPEPAAPDCPCFNQELADNDPSWLQDLRAWRLRPAAPQSAPGDADYGVPVNLCLPQGFPLTKHQAINAFESQMGTAGRASELIPESRRGLADCNGYLLSFARSSEIFFLDTLQ
jgi:LmbE family N-acetylglucosaminyl deacetylase